MGTGTCRSEEKNSRGSYTFTVFIVTVQSLLSLSNSIPTYMYLMYLSESRIRRHKTSTLMYNHDIKETIAVHMVLIIRITDLTPHSSVDEF